MVLFRMILNTLHCQSSDLTCYRCKQKQSIKAGVLCSTLKCRPELMHVEIMYFLSVITTFFLKCMLDLHVHVHVGICWSGKWHKITSTSTCTCTFTCTCTYMYMYCPTSSTQPPVAQSKQDPCKWLGFC